MKYDQFVLKRSYTYYQKNVKYMEFVDKPISYLGPSLVDTENLSIDAFI